MTETDMANSRCKRRKVGTDGNWWSQDDTTSRQPTVIVLGAGAMGCFLGGLLAECGLDVTLFRRNSVHVSAVNERGLQITGYGGDRSVKIKATTRLSELGTYDVVLLLCKATDTKSIIEAATHLFHESSVAVSLQNGLGNEDIMANALGGPGHVLGGLSAQGASMEGPGVVHAHTNLPTYIGEWTGGPSTRCARLCSIFSAHGLPAEEDADIRRRIWMKLLGNCAWSPMSTLTDLSLRDLFKRADGYEVGKDLIREALTVAHAEGVKISSEESTELLDKIIAANQANKASMCNYILAHRRTEIDFINGAVVALAQKHDLDVPLNRAMVFFVKAFEARFSGE